MQTLVVFGYYGFANAGDEAILAGMLQQLRAERRDLRVIVASGNPEETTASHGVESVSWNDIDAVQAAIERSDAVVIGGGGLFHDYWGADPDTVLTSNHWGVSYYAGCAILARLWHKPLMMYAVGVGPLLSEQGKRLTRVAFELSSVITVRDEDSRQELVGLGIAADKIELAADPALSLTPNGAVSIDENLSQPVLGAAVRSWEIGVSLPYVVRELAATFDKWVDRTGGSVLLFPFQELAGERENDRAIAERILAAMRCGERARVSNPLSYEEISGAFGNCAVILGMRLHALIFAANAGVPAVALSYDPKVAAFATSCNGQMPLVEVTSFDARSLSCHLVDVWRAGQIPDVESLRRTSYNSLRALMALLEAPPEFAGLPDECIELLGRGLRANTGQISQWKGEAERNEERLQTFNAENQTLRSTIAGYQKEQAEAKKYVKSLEDRHSSFLARKQKFESDFAANLRLQREQRAWRAMLAIRKAYTLLFRRSGLSFLRWVLGLPLGRVGSLNEYEPTFPEVRNYLPDVPEVIPPETPEPVVHHSVPRSKHDVLILAVIDFDFRFQRPQQFAAEWARRGHRVFWVSPSRFVPPSESEAFASSELRKNIVEVHLRCPPPDIYRGELREEHIDPMLESISHLRDDFNLADTVIVAQLPFWRRLALKLRERFSWKLLYDCMDDWDTFPNIGKFNVREEKFLIRECDILVVTGAALDEKFRAQGLDPILVRNGADYEFFSDASPNRLLEGVTRPIIGYFGAIADWIDLDLITAVAKLRPGYSFVLIGQVFDRDVSELQALPNVQLLGNQPYETIPSYLFHFDACTIPFLLNAVTKATDPVKLYEYFSLGKPVVATAMAELQQCGDLIYISSDAPDFATKLDRAVSENDRSLRERRVAFAKANTWSSRVERTEEAVSGTYPLVSILIVTHNSADFIGPCLESVFGNTSYPNYEVLVIDNQSKDETALILKEYVRLFPRLRTRLCEENLGFSRANNWGANQSSGEYLLFLNADTMVTPGWAYNLLRHFQSNPKLGLLCPVTNFAGNEARIPVSYRDSEQMEAFAVGRTREFRSILVDVAVVPLFCGVTTRAVWDASGGLDESFAIGMFEDDDFSDRIRALGYRVAIAEDCFVHHFGQGSFAQLSPEKYNELFEQNRKRFETKWRKQWIAHKPRPDLSPLTDADRFKPSEFIKSERLLRQHTKSRSQVA